MKNLLAEGRCPPWVTGDEVYGRDAKLCAFLEEQGIGYVLKIPCSFRVTLPAGQKVCAVMPPGWRGRCLADRLGRARVQRANETTGGRGWPPPRPAITCSSAAAAPSPLSWLTFSATCPRAGPTRSPR